MFYIYYNIKEERVIKEIKLYINMENYTVLMSVYKSESPSNLDCSIKSILNQTFITNDFVIVCDGPVSNELENILLKVSKDYSIITLIKKQDNTGLGDSLRIGLLSCKNNLVMRMDSDDISLPERAEKEIAFLTDNHLDLVSSNVDLFSDDSKVINGTRTVPSKHEDIVKFSKKRSPFNHPSILFKKDIVLKAGNYRNLRYRQDYDLWIRCIQAGAVCGNIKESLVLMRTGSELIKRRKNKVAYQCSIDIFKYMKKTKYIGRIRYLLNRIVYAIQYYSPTFITKIAYRKMHKKN